MCVCVRERERERMCARACLCVCVQNTYYICMYTINIYIYIYSTRGVMVLLDINTVTRDQMLDESVCISHSANALGKGMNSIIVPPAMGK